MKMYLKLIGGVHVILAFLEVLLLLKVSRGRWLLGCGGGAGSPETTSCGGEALGSPELADPALQGLVWPRIWPRSSSTAWVIHWWAQKGSSGLGTACAAMGVGLCGGARRRAMFSGL